MNSREKRATIRKQLTKSSVWEAVENMKTYDSHDFIVEFSEYLTNDLKKLILNNVGQIQKYFDERILTPKK